MEVREGIVMGTFHEEILRRVRFDEFHIDTKGILRLVRHHNLCDTTAQIGRRRLSVWARPNWLAYFASILLLPFSLIGVFAAYCWTSKAHKDELMQDVLTAFRPDVPVIQFPPVKPAEEKKEEKPEGKPPEEPKVI
jgi:hypothetical protein